MQEALTNIWKQLTKDEDHVSFTIEYREKLLTLYQMKYPSCKVSAVAIPGNPYGFEIIIEAPEFVDFITIDDNDPIMKIFIVNKE